MLFKLSNLNSNFVLTLDYLNPALNNSARCLRHIESVINLIVHILMDIHVVVSSRLSMSQDSIEGYKRASNLSADQLLVLIVGSDP